MQLVHDPILQEILDEEEELYRRGDELLRMLEEQRHRLLVDADRSQEDFSI